MIPPMDWKRADLTLVKIRVERCIYVKGEQGFCLSKQNIFCLLD